LKAYTWVILFVFARQTGVRDGYEPFLCIPPLGPPGGTSLASGQTREKRIEEVQASFLQRLAPFDGQFYLDIAERGYRIFGKDDPNAAHGPGGNYAFFPLYPLLLWCARWAGRPADIALLVILNTALSSAAAVGVYRLAERIGAPAWPSVLFLETFPTSVFQNVLYTESIFLCLSVGVALCASRNAFRGGAVLGYLAGLCRPQGVLVGALWLRQILGRADAAGSRRRAWSAALVPLLGVATFSILLWYQIGAPLGFLGIQSHWARQFSLGNLVEEATSPLGYKGPPFDFLALLLGVGLVPFLWRKLPGHLALFGTLSVLLPLSTGTMLSFGRFLSVSFPHFLVLSMLLEGWRLAGVTLLAAFIVIQCLLAKGLVGWYFVG
jgi:hypothetical protein